MLHKRVRPRAMVYRLFHRLGLAWRYHVRRARTRQPVFLISEPRTGSNLLLDYLNSSPSVGATDEVLNPWSIIGLHPYYKTPRARLRHVAHSVNMPSDIGIVKLMLQHLRWHRLSMDDLHARFPDAKYIFLYRRDLFAQLVSMETLLRTGVDRTRSEQQSRPRLRIPRERLVRYCNVTRGAFEGALQHDWLAGRCIVLCYEELAAEPERLFADVICPFLGIPPFEIRSSLKKQGAKDPRHLVENFDELDDLAGAPLTTLHLSYPLPALSEPFVDSSRLVVSH